MISNGTTFSFSPFWLISLSKEEQGIVRAWMQEAGVNLDMCPGFDYDGKLITTRYYAQDPMGRPQISQETDQPIYEDFVREFPAVNPPKSVKEMMLRA
jgi:hypothetical protein